MSERRTVEQFNPAADPVDLTAVSCCTTFYELDWVRQIAQDGFHPGGRDLTRRMVSSMNLSAGARIADIGCGAGTTARILSSEGYSVHAIDLGLNSLATAERDQKQNHGSSTDIRFIQADANHLPFATNSFDAVLAECSFSLVTNKREGLQEFKRVLRSGGELGISDMATAGALPADMADVIMPWTCLADAYEQEQYEALFEAAGFELQVATDESDGLLKMISSLKRKLLMLAAGTAFGQVDIPNLDIDAVRYWMARFLEEVENGRIRYLRFNLRNAN